MGEPASKAEDTTPADRLPRCLHQQVPDEHSGDSRSVETRKQAEDRVEEDSRDEGRPTRGEN
eukprot:3350993-Pleurochrysis_carterae.AAC.1